MKVIYISCRPLGVCVAGEELAPVCTMGIVQEWLEEHKVLKVLSWPPNYPNLNLIKHLWDVMDKGPIHGGLTTYRT